MLALLSDALERVVKLITIPHLGYGVWSFLLVCGVCPPPPGAALLSCWSLEFMRRLSIQIPREIGIGVV